MSRKKITSNVVAAAFDAVAPKEGARGFLDRVGPTHALPAYETTKPLQTLTRQVLLEFIDPDPDQPRKSMDQQELADLAASIKQSGILQYVTLQKLADSDRYRVVAGHRRVEAARIAGLDAVPAIIRPEDYDKAKVRVEQLVENIQRADLAPLDAARALESFMKSEKLSQREAADRLGKQVIFVNELLAILKIDAKLLPKAEHLPKRVLIEIGRAETLSEQKRLLDLALANPKAPHTAVKAARSQKSDRRPERYPYRYPIEDYGATVVVTFDEEPDDTDSHVAEVLSVLVAQLSGDSRKPTKKGRRG